MTIARDRLREAMNMAGLGWDPLTPDTLVLVRYGDLAEVLGEATDREAAGGALADKRQQGQREGKAAVISWLRERSAMKPPPTLWHCAQLLADQFEASEQPCLALHQKAPK